MRVIRSLTGTCSARKGKQMERMFFGVVALVAALLIGTVPASAAGGTTFYIGHGERRDAKVSFMVRGGEVRSALLDIRKMPVKRPDGTTEEIQVYGKVAKAPSDSNRDSHFFGVRKTRSDSGKSRFGITGHLWRTRNPDGHMSMKVTSDALQFNTGKIRWNAKPVSKHKFKKFRGPGGPYTDGS